VNGAHLNVRINTKDLDDPPYVEDVSQRAAEMAARAETLERETLAAVDGNM
jgi:formiminotetrahydrofolate cyclodeaminase